MVCVTLASWFGIIPRISTILKRRLASLPICIRGLGIDLVLRSTGQGIFETTTAFTISRNPKIEVLTIFSSKDLSAICDALNVSVLVARISITEKRKL